MVFSFCLGPDHSKHGSWPCEVVGGDHLITLMRSYVAEQEKVLNIFAEFEGLSGENLSSAILHYLLLNSEEVREVLIDYLSNNSPQGLIRAYEHFSVRKEYPTYDKALGNGRLDLLIQVDNFAIGIENKFHASFQDGQPEK